MQRALDDGDAGFLVGVVALDGDGVASLEQHDAAARDDAFLDRGAGRIERVVDAVLALLHLDLGGAADANDRNAAGQFG